MKKYILMVATLFPISQFLFDFNNVFCGYIQSEQSEKKYTAEEIFKKLQTDEPSGWKFMSFNRLPREIYDSFDLDNIDQDRKDELMQVFKQEKGYPVISYRFTSPRFLSELTSEQREEGNAKTLIPFLEKSITSLKQYYRDIKGSAPFDIVTDSMRMYVGAIIWYYTWFLRLLEYPDKPLFSEITTPEGLKKEQRGLIDLLYGDEGLMGNWLFVKSVRELLLNRLSVIENLINQQENNKIVSDDTNK